MTLVAPVWSRLALAVALGCASTARAEQFIVTDVTYTHAADTTTDSHYHVDPRPGTPSNWKSPVDYSQGSAHVLLEVKTKPGDTETKFQICFEGAPAYACTNQSPTYSTTGKYEWTTPFANFYQGDGVGVNWSKGIKKVALILKDTMNNKPQGDPKYVPTALRVEVAIVSKGATYMAPVQDAGVSDAGGPTASDAGTDAAAATDAGDAGSRASDAGVDARTASDATLASMDAKSDIPSAEAAAPSHDTGSAPPARVDAGSGGDTDDDAPAGGDGGCNLARGPRGSAAASLLLIALMLWLARIPRPRWRRASWRSRGLALACLGLGACGGGDEAPANAGADAGVPDAAAPLDASMSVDAAPADAAAPVDAGKDAAPVSDGGAPDATTDAASEAGEPLDPSVPSRFLSETGLYSDAAQTVLASGVQLYQVRLELWADGATKKRFLYLPPGSKIDTTDPDAWVFPVGTKVWKEFTRDGVRVETRLIEKAAAGRRGWKFVAYAWNSGQSAAEAVPLGRTAVLGTAHDVPTQTNCENCHEGSPDFVLGVSAFGLPIDGAGVSLASLVQDGKLTQPITAAQVAIPGNAAAQAALGELHANCGSCHRPGTFAWERAELELRLKVGVKTVQEMPAYKSAVNVAVGQIFENIPMRITPGNPEASAVYTRMISRADKIGMPNIGTKIVDTAGSKRVADWIRSLTP